MSVDDDGIGLHAVLLILVKFRSGNPGQAVDDQGKHGIRNVHRVQMIPSGVAVQTNGEDIVA